MNKLQQNQQQVEQCFKYPIAIQISNIKSHVDLNMYRKNQRESTFIEIIDSKKSNIVVGCVCKHPNMDMLDFNTLGTNPRKWSDTLKQFFSNSQKFF